MGIHWWEGGGVSTRFIGSLSDVRIYNRALSSAEIQELSQSGSPTVPTITSVNVGPAGGGNLTMSIQGSGFGSASGIPNALTNLIVYDINPVTGATNWSAGGAGDWDTINITSWTGNEIDIANFKFSPFTGDHFSSDDQVMLQVQNPQTQGGWSTPYVLTLPVTFPPGYLVLEIQAPTTGFPLVISDTEFANLVNPIVTQLQQHNLVQIEPSAFFAAVLPNGQNDDLEVVNFLATAPFDVGGTLLDAADVGEMGWWVAEETVASQLNGFQPAPSSPVEIASDVAVQVLYNSQMAQEFLFKQPGILCYSFPMKGQANQNLTGNLDFFVCNGGFLTSGNYLKVLIALSALPQPQSPIDLRWILGHWGWGVPEVECGQITTLGTIYCGGQEKGGLSVNEYSFNYMLANQSVYGNPTFSAHVIDGFGNPVSATVPVPTGPADFTIITSNSPPDGGTNSGGGGAYSNSVVTVTARPSSCCTFSCWSWNGIVVSLLPNYSFTATTNQTLVANFTTNFYTITMTNSPPDGGTTTGGGTIACGTSVTVTANANLGYAFADWTNEVVGFVSQSSNYTFTAGSDSNLVANFAPLGSSIIRTVATPPFAGSTSGDGLYTNGQSETLTATVSDSCYAFVNWTTNGTQVGTSTNYPFTVATNQVFTANFAPISYNVAVYSSAGGTVNDGGAFNCGTPTIIQASPAECYSFVGWTENGLPVSGAANYSFTIDTNHNFVANFAPVAFSITSGVFPSGEGTTSGDESIGCGESVTLVATPNSGYTFFNWTQGGTIVSSSSSYTFTPTGNQLLIANFAPNFPVIGFGSPLWNTGNFDLTLQGPIGSNYEIDASIDLFNWLPLTNFVSTNSPSFITDPAPTNFNQRFYRAVMQ